MFTWIKISRARQIDMAIEHAQKLKSLVEVAENPCWEWNFRAECTAKNLYTSMTTEVELCNQMIGDGIAHGIIVKVGVILALPEWIFFSIIQQIQHYTKVFL